MTVVVRVSLPLQSRESDVNGDRTNDALTLTVHFAGLSHRVHTVKLLLFFRAEFKVSCILTAYNIPCVPSVNFACNL